MPTVLETLMGQLSSMDGEAKAELLARVDAATRGLKFIPNPGPQTTAMLHPADEVLFGGSGGGGKGLLPSHPVLTPFGWREIGKLRVGDALCATDGTVQQVIGVYHRGVQPLYKLHWENGDEDVCDEDHIWLVRFADNMTKFTTKQIYSLYSIPDNFVEIPLYQSDSMLRLRHIKSYGHGETVCIAVSHPNSLFVIGGNRITHNTALGVGLAFTDHYRSLLLRRQYSDLSGLVDQAVAINGSRDGFTQMPRPKFRLSDEKVVDFGAAQYAGDEQAFQGQARDYYYFDELTQFLESQYRYIIGWNRPGPGVPSDQRCRVLCGSNPPTTSDGDWVIGYWRPWLDPTYDKPAADGEIRWVITDADGKDKWVESGEPFTMGGRVMRPKSRTFIRATLQDNPYLVNSNYAATLDSLPEPLRSALRDGNFMLSREDTEGQIFPMRWLREAQARWSKEAFAGQRMTALGVDVADGGADLNVAAAWYGDMLDVLKVESGKILDQPQEVAAFVVRHRRNGCPVAMDMGGGYGGAPSVLLEQSDIEITPFKGSLGTEARSACGQYYFYNLVTEAYWRLREALDPTREGGSTVALPPDQGLISEMAGITFETIFYKSRLTIKKESKVDFRKRRGSSPDRMDAAVIGWWLNHKLRRQASRVGGVNIPKVNLSHKSRRRR